MSHLLTVKSLEIPSPNGLTVDSHFTVSSIYRDFSMKEKLSFPVCIRYLANDLSHPGERARS